MEEYVTLETLGEGAAIELFNDELRKVLENILDPNTEADKAREIKLLVKIIPNDDRSITQTVIECTSKLASARGVKTILYVGRKNGDAVATEHNPKQGKLFDQPQKPADITNLKEAR